MEDPSTRPDSSLTRRTLLTGLLALGVASCATPGSSTPEMPASTDRGLLGHTRHGNGGEPVVVLHEWMGDHTNFDLLLPFLPEDSNIWLFADLRGYGLSKSMSGAYSLQEATDDVFRLMDSYGYKRFHVVGHSMSGMISQYIAKIGGERIKSVVLISPVPASGFRANEKTMKTLMAVIDDDGAARDAILARGGTRYGRGWLDCKLMMTRRASNRDAMIGYLKMFTGTDVADQVRGTPTPISVVCGEHDIPLYREESLRKLLEPLFPNITLAVSREAGHYSMLETPPLLAGYIEKGLARGV